MKAWEVMRAYENGARIESSYKGQDNWIYEAKPKWDWTRFDYRVQPTDK